MTFVQTITDVNTPQLIGNDVHNCPNCGAPVSIGELKKGCPYCSSHFEISDIFPKVSNYYFYKDPSMTEKEYRAHMAKFMIGCGMSFDATKEKHCPSCGTEYDLGTSIITI